MKKIFAFIAVAMAFVATSCGHKAVVDTDETLGAADSTKVVVDSVVVDSTETVVVDTVAVEVPAAEVAE